MVRAGLAFVAGSIVSLASSSCVHAPRRDESPPAETVTPHAPKHRLVVRSFIEIRTGLARSGQLAVTVVCFDAEVLRAYRELAQ